MADVDGSGALSKVEVGKYLCRKDRGEDSTFKLHQHVKKHCLFLSIRSFSYAVITCKCNKSMWFKTQASIGGHKCCFCQSDTSEFADNR